MRGQLLQALDDRASSAHSVSLSELQAVMDLYWAGVQCRVPHISFLDGAAAAAPSLALAFFASNCLGAATPADAPASSFVHSFVRLYQV